MHLSKVICLPFIRCKSTSIRTFSQKVLVRRGRKKMNESQEFFKEFEGKGSGCNCVVCCAKEPKLDLNLKRRNLATCIRGMCAKCETSTCTNNLLIVLTHRYMWYKMCMRPCKGNTLQHLLHRSLALNPKQILRSTIYNITYKVHRLSSYHLS